jgi:hypothetical protein
MPCPPRLWDAYLAGRLLGVRPRRQRQGPDHLDNFAWSCPFCHRAKGGRTPIDRSVRAALKQGALYRRRHDRVHWVMGRAGVDGAVRSIH